MVVIRRKKYCVFYACLWKLINESPFVGTCSFSCTRMYDSRLVRAYRVGTCRLPLRTLRSCVSGIPRLILTLLSALHGCQANMFLLLLCRVPNIVETARKSSGAAMIVTDPRSAVPVTSKRSVSPRPDACQLYPTLHSSVNVGFEWKTRDCDASRRAGEASYSTAGRSGYYY